MQARDLYPGYKNTLFRNIVTSLVMQRTLFKCRGRIGRNQIEIRGPVGIRQSICRNRKKKEKERETYARTFDFNNKVVLGEKND